MCSRAQGGFGVVETCAGHVTRDGQNWPGQLGICDDALLPGLKRLSAAIRQRGPASIFQLFHARLLPARCGPSTTPKPSWHWGADAAAVGRAAVANPDWAYRGRRPELGASPPTVTLPAG